MCLKVRKIIADLVIAGLIKSLSPEYRFNIFTTHGRLSYIKESNAYVVA